MGKKNAFLMQMQAKADKKASAKTEAHVEIDTMAMLLAIHDICQVGSGRAGKVVNSFLAYKMEIAEAIIKELDEDKSKKKEIIILRRDLAARMKEILGKEGWEQYKTLFPFLRDYWEW
jgi:hypothetical protein